MYKSTDGAVSWRAVNTHLSVVTALAIDPTTSSTLYAGTSQLCGKSQCVGVNGLFKSTDAGRTWDAADAGLPSSYFNLRALVIDPARPGTLYAVTDYPGAFKSTDGGATWGALVLPLNSEVAALVIDPTTPSTLYAGTPAGVFKSTDAGATWEAFNAGQSLSVCGGFLAIHPSAPGTLHAGGCHSGVLFSIQQVDGCIGDCDDSGAVRVNELVTLINIGLGEAPPAACPLPDNAAVDISWIIAAVDDGLHGCPSE